MECGGGAPVGVRRKGCDEIRRPAGANIWDLPRENGKLVIPQTMKGQWGAPLLIGGARVMKD